MKWNNPVLLREMRARVRGRRSLVVHLIFLTLFLLIYLPLYYFLLREEVPWRENSRTFMTLLFVLLGFVSVSAPAFCSGSITGEREQKTLSFLLASPLSARTIVTGKLFSAFFFSSLLLLTTLPLLFFAFIVGGVEGLRFFLALLLLFISSLFFAVLALFFSSVSKRTASATALSYGCIIALLIGTAILDAYLSSRPPLPNGEPHPLSGALYLNPFIGLYTIFEGGKELEKLMPYKAVPLPIWVVNMLVFLFLTLLLWWLTVRKFKKLEKT